MASWVDLGIEIPAGASGEVSTLCPNCSHQRKKGNAKCLRANVASGVFLCHHCGWKGAVDGARRPLGAPRSFKRPEDDPSIVQVRDRALEWLLDRRISPLAIQRNQIGCRGDVVVFPYFRDGEVVNRKYRSITDKKFWMEADAELLLWGLDDIAGEETAIIVEGEMDRLALETAGYTNVLSVPNGAPPVGAKNLVQHLAYLETAERWLKPLRTVVLAGDADAPGLALREELIRRLGKERCKTVEWPGGCKDANDVLLKLGSQALRLAVEAAKFCPIDGVFDLDEGAVADLYEHGLQRGVGTGWPSLDEFFTVAPGQLTIISGYAGSGKSNWLDAMAVNIARRSGWSFAFFSPENLPLADHMARTIEKYIGQPFSPGPTPRMSREQLQHGMAWAQEHFAWICPHDAADWRLEKILEHTSTLIFRKGIRGLIIDPWNELESLRPDGMTETEYVSHTLKKLRAYARDKGIHVFLVAHPQKLYRDKGNSKFPVPTLFDISGSANFRHKADNGIVVYRDIDDADSKEVRIYVQKIRFRQIGRLGMAVLQYDPPTATYSDLSAPPNYTERDDDESPFLQ